MDKGCVLAWAFLRPTELIGFGPYSGIKALAFFLNQLPIADFENMYPNAIRVYSRTKYKKAIMLSITCLNMTPIINGFIKSRFRTQKENINGIRWLSILILRLHVSRNPHFYWSKTT